MGYLSAVQCLHSTLPLPVHRYRRAYRARRAHSVMPQEYLILRHTLALSVTSAQSALATRWSALPVLTAMFWQPLLRQTVLHAPGVTNALMVPLYRSVVLKAHTAPWVPANRSRVRQSFTAQRFRLLLEAARPLITAQPVLPRLFFVHWAHTVLWVLHGPQRALQGLTHHMISRQTHPVHHWSPHACLALLERILRDLMDFRVCFAGPDTSAWVEHPRWNLSVLPRMVVMRARQVRFARRDHQQNDRVRPVPLMPLTVVPMHRIVSLATTTHITTCQVKPRAGLVRRPPIRTAPGQRLAPAVACIAPSKCPMVFAFAHLGMNS
jgi:hypothetical protein